MGKNYQRRENYNQLGNNEQAPVDSYTEETSSEGSTSEVLSSMTAGQAEPAGTEDTPVIVSEPTPLPSPVVHTHAVTPTPTTTPVISQPQKVTMLPIQSELTALAQDINPKLPVQPRWQYTLFNLMKSVLETQDNSEFHQQWSALLNFYHAAKGTAFSDMYILRFSDEWPGSDSEFSLFRRLVHVVSQTSEPQTRRKSAVMINFSRATEGLGEDAGNRLIGFYA